MIKYNRLPQKDISLGADQIISFIENTSLDDENIDWETVQSFGEEWEKFNHFSNEEVNLIGSDYFDIVPDEVLNFDCVALDVGCGSGRWTKFVAPRVKFVEAIDPSKAVVAAHNLLRNYRNVRITQASVDKIPFPDNSFDLVFSLGVLHHIPDTQQAMKKCVEKIKPNGFFLVYLYYNLDNRSTIFKLLFKLTNFFRSKISRFPAPFKKLVCELIAMFVYLPLSLLSRLVYSLTKSKKWTQRIPLSYYRDKSWNVIRNDALDRFGTPLEQRFSRIEIEKMMKDCGLKNIVFSSNEPYWHAIGQKHG